VDKVVAEEIFRLMRRIFHLIRPVAELEPVTIQTRN
jgi:hypothetical protein